jgi:hypothetical protein
VNERSAALGAGALAAIVTAVPAAPRVAEYGAHGALVFASLAGGTALVLGPGLVAAGAVRTETNGFRSVLLGLALAALPLSILADVLKQNTHHRPLGAATFAVLALALVLGFVAATWRLFVVLEERSFAVRRVSFAIAVALSLAGVGAVLVRALGSPTLVAHVLDGLRALATATLCHLLLRFPRVVSIARRVGAPVWAFVVVAGLVAGRGATGAAIRANAPVLGGPVAWF